MRFLMLPVVLALSSSAWAQTAQPATYSPAFARIAEPAEVLSWELCPKPAYPRASLRNEETGVVTIRITVAPTGHVLGTSVAASSGFRDLDKAANGALARCRFRPASIDGVPVQTTTLVQYVWTLG